MKTLGWNLCENKWFFLGFYSFKMYFNLIVATHLKSMSICNETKF